MARKIRRISKSEIKETLPPVKAPKWVQGFVDFIREQGVVGLAVAFILGVASKSVIDSLVNNVVNPLVGLFYSSGGELDGKYWCLKQVGNSCTNRLGYGSFANQLINFVIIAGVVYFIVKILNLDKLDKKK